MGKKILDFESITLKKLDGRSSRFDLKDIDLVLALKTSSVESLSLMK